MIILLEVFVPSEAKPHGWFSVANRLVFKAFYSAGTRAISPFVRLKEPRRARHAVGTAFDNTNPSADQKSGSSFSTHLLTPLVKTRNWGKAQELRAALEELRRTLVAYAELLGTVAGVPSLVEGPELDQRE